METFVSMSKASLQLWNVNSLNWFAKYKQP
jgi:hypothetical protein